jgi:ABC-type transporter Mla MlaB component
MAEGDQGVVAVVHQGERTSVTCVLDRLTAADVATVEEVFLSGCERVIVDLRKVTTTTPDGVARLTHLVRRARQRQVTVEFESVRSAARRALVAAGLHHLVNLSE